MSCFTAITDNNKYILPCNPVYKHIKTKMNIYPGFEDNCECYNIPKEFDYCLKNTKPVAVIRRHPKEKE